MPFALPGAPLSWLTSVDELWEDEARCSLLLAAVKWVRRLLRRRMAWLPLQQRRRSRQSEDEKRREISSDQQTGGSTVTLGTRGRRCGAGPGRCAMSSGSSRSRRRGNKCRVSNFRVSCEACETYPEGLSLLAPDLQNWNSVDFASLTLDELLAMAADNLE